MPELTRNFQIVQLSTDEPAKPFDGMACGNFTDMYGRKTSIKPDELAAYVKNTRALIASTKSESGDVVGLPIDCINHDHGNAAGWITDVELDEGGQKIRFTPRWNETGQWLISSDTQRFFSPTIDIANRVIMGGSLTNWPATRTASQILLRPIELSQSDLIDGSLDDRVISIRKAFMDQFFNGGWDDPYPVECWNDHLVCQWADELYQVDFTEKDGEFTFAAQAEWRKIKLSYVNAALKFLSRLFTRPGQAEPVINGASTPAPITDHGEKTMPEPTLEAVLASPANAAELNKLIDERANARVAELLEREHAKSHIAEFCASVTGGTETCPVGLPVTSTELADFLTSLSADQLTAAEALLTKIQTAKAVDFAEHGHGRTLNGNRELPPEIAVSLRSWLENPANTVEQFFADNAVELGSQSDYNLSMFQKQEK